MKFLLRWGVRLGLFFGVPALLASSDLAAAGASLLWTGYLLWIGRRTLLEHVRRFWAWTSFRSYAPGALRLAHLKGDTL